MELKLNLSTFSTHNDQILEDHIYDVVIIGGGPAALNAALYCARKDLDAVLVADEIGGQIIKSVSIDNWLGVSSIESSTLINKFFEHIKEYHVKIYPNYHVNSVELDGLIKKIHTQSKAFSAKSIIVATGNQPRCLGILGEQEFIGRGVAYCTTCDGPAFKNKKVVVVGGGNSGVEAAIDMLSYATEIVIVQNSDQLTADQILVQKILSESKISIIYNTICEKIEGTDSVEKLTVKNMITQEKTIIHTDGIFVEIGSVPASKFLPDSMKNENGEVIVNNRSETVIEGVFAAGDVTDTPFKQVAIAVGEGAKSALAAFQYLIKYAKYIQENHDDNV